MSAAGQRRVDQLVDFDDDQDGGGGGWLPATFSKSVLIPGMEERRVTDNARNPPAMGAAAAAAAAAAASPLGQSAAGSSTMQTARSVPRFDSFRPVGPAAAGAQPAHSPAFAPAAPSDRNYADLAAVAADARAGAGGVATKMVPAASSPQYSPTALITATGGLTSWETLSRQAAIDGTADAVADDITWGPSASPALPEGVLLDADLDLDADGSGAPAEASFSTQPAPSSIKENLLLTALKALQTRNQQLRERVRTLRTDLAAAEERAERATSKQGVNLERLLGKDFLRNKEAGGAGRRDDLRFALRADAAEAADHELDDEEEYRDMSCAGRVRRWWGRVTDTVDRHFPFNEDVRVITTRFGHASGAYYRFYQWATLLNMLMGVLWTPSLVLHSMFHFSLGITSGYLPVGFRYSSFDVSEAWLHTATMCVSLVVIAAIALRKVTTEDRLRREDMMLLESDSATRFSNALFSAWEYNAWQLARAEDGRMAASDRFRVLYAEDERAALVRARTRAERAALVLRRVLANLAIAVLLVGACVVIILLAVFRQTISTTLQNSNAFLALFSNLVTPLALAALNGITPLIVILLTDFEKWDDPAFRLKKLVVSLYLLRMLNFFVLLSTYVALLWPDMAAVVPGLAVEAKQGTCAQDQTGEDLVQLVMTDTVVGMITQALSTAALRLFAYMRRTPPTVELDIGRDVIALIYSLGLSWVTLPYYPFAAWILLLSNPLRFKFNTYMILRWYTRPNNAWSAKDTGLFFITSTLGTFALVVLFYYLFLAVIVPSCGPHSGAAAGTVLTAWMAAVPGVSQLLAIASNGWVLWGVVLVTIARAEVLRNAQAVLSAVLVDRHQQSASDQQMFSGIIKRLRARIAELTARLRDREKAA